MEGYGIILVFLLLCFVWNIYSENINNKIISCFCAIILGMIFIVTLIYYNFKDKPTALDVYRNKTTLEITYRNSIPVDSVVVYKDKFKKIRI